MNPTALLMERIIIQGIQRLRVLTPYDYDNMDELVHDLSNALDETASRSTGKSKKGKCWKRRPKAGTSIANSTTLGCSLPKSSAVSEDSESSLDDRMRCHMEISVGSSHPQTDSDELVGQNKNHLLSWRHCVASLVESDSVNENFLPMLPHRRKRKFKRMAIDPQPIGAASSNEVSTSINSNSKPTVSISPKPRRMKSIRAMKCKGRHSRLLDVDIENICGLAAMKRESATICGKRKRSMRERSVECTRHEVHHEFKTPLPGISVYCDSDISRHMECDDSQRGKNHMDGSSSSLSSSESDGGLFTNDEGREADDEHSDFFHEAGPTCGIPNINPWWEDGTIDGMDAQFQSILSNSFQHMSKEAQEAYQDSVSRYMAGVGREIRSGRRRLGEMRPSFSVMSSVNEKISKFMQDPLLNELKLENLQNSDDEQLNHLATLYSLEVQNVGQSPNRSITLVKTRRTTQVVNEDSNHCKVSLSDIKRRRRMPPIGGVAADGGFPISDGNIGNLMLRSMGWEPGNGLGPNAQGILNPLMACVRAKYQGLGYGSLNSGCGILSNDSMQAPPPPPPPSPQPASSGGDTPHSESLDAMSSIILGHFQQDITGEKVTDASVR